MTVTIYQDIDGWRWRAKAPHNEIHIASGEPYEKRSEAEHIVNLIFGMTAVELQVVGADGKTQRSYRLR